MRTLVRFRLLVAALAVAVAFPAVGLAKPFSSWWKKPPVDPVVDVTFDPVSATHAGLQQFTVVSSRIQSRVKTTLVDSTTKATVAASQITVDPITLADANATTTVKVTLNPAPLLLGCLGSSFRAAGTAEIVVGTTTQTVPVFVCGQINTVNGQYLLRASVQGAAYTQTAPGSFNFQLLHFDLSGQVAVPPPPTPPVIPTP